MRAVGSLATVLLVVGATGGCAPADGEDAPTEEAPEEEQPLDLTVDSLDIVHGALRLSATMVDGAADVSVRIGGECPHREVGGGVSTPSTLVWSFGDQDIADAIGCAIEVRAHVRDGARHVNKVAGLVLSLDVAAQDAEREDGPRVQSIGVLPTGVDLGFASVAHGARLITGDSILDPAPGQPVSNDPAPDDDAPIFNVPRLDFARSLLRGQPFRLSGSSFVTSFAVAGVSVESEPQGPQVTDVPQSDEPDESDQPQEEPEENVSEQGPEEG
jgi:hypothetical protein